MSPPLTSAEENIIAYVASLLAGVPNATVYRSRSESVERAEGIVINVLPMEEDFSRQTDPLETGDLKFEVRVTARGQVPDSLADPVVIASHQAIMADRSLGNRCSKLTRVKKTWQLSEADLNACVVSTEYRARYQTLASNGSIVQ